MSWRILNHTLFWFCYLSLYVIIHMLFVSPSDEIYSFPEKLLRFYFRELAFLPWKMLPFYFLFYYLIPKYFPKGEYVKLGVLFLTVIFICLLGYRSTIEPLQRFMYGDGPDFNVFSLSRIFYSFSDFLPAIALASSAKLLKGSIVSRRKEMTLEAEKLEAELNFLKAQINPHFLFNTLNNLYGLARRSDINTAPSIMKLSNIMRYILYDCSSKTNPLQNEISIIEDYIELEKLRYDNRLEVKFEKSLNNFNKEIAPLILLPFVENAFKHGASENRTDTFIDIYLELQMNKLIFKIVNTREDEHTVLNEGVGLKNVKRQLDLIYGEHYQLDISSERNLFTVNLSINTDSNGAK